MATRFALVASSQAEQKSKGADGGNHPAQATTRLLLLPRAGSRGSSASATTANSEPSAVGRSGSSRSTTVSRISLLGDLDALR